MFPGLKTVHKVLGVDGDIGIEHVQPLGQVLLHGVQILVSSGETSQLSLLHQLEREWVLLTVNINKLGQWSRISLYCFVQIFYIYFFPGF